MNMAQDIKNSELMTEVAELTAKPSKVFELAEKTHYNRFMNPEEKEAAQIFDAYFSRIPDVGDNGNELSQFITRTVQDELYNAPDELLDTMFERGTIGEFDDYQSERVAKNTLVAYEAGKGGNVPRSYLNFEVIKPKTVNLQVESDISYRDIRKAAWKTVATLTTYMSEAAKNKMFYYILNAVDEAIPGGEQVITSQGSEPTMQDMDALTLYLNEYANGENPFTVSLLKYCAKMRRMTGYAQYLSDAAKDEFNRYGLVKTYDGVAITGISSAKKLGDGSLLIPD